MIFFDVDFIPRGRIIGAEFSMIAKGFRSFRQPLEKSVESAMIQHIIEQFEVGGEPSWEPLADATIERRSRQGTLDGYPQDILVETGTLFESATKKARWKITGDEAYFSNLPSRAEYGYFHLTGTNYMPARPFIQLTAKEIDEVQGIFGRWVDGIIITKWMRRTRHL